MKLIAIVLRLRSLEACSKVPAEQEGLLENLWAEHLSFSPLDRSTAAITQSFLPGGESDNEFDLRLTCLDPAQSEVLLTEWLPSIPSKLTHIGRDWEVSGVYTRTEEHPWAGQISYHDLVTQHLNNHRPARSWLVHLITPAIFQIHPGGFPFPTPESLVHSWEHNWQAFGPVPLPVGLLEFVAKDVHLGWHNLTSQRLQHSRILGCNGSLELFSGRMELRYRAALDTLATFAFYAGSGLETSHGFGVTRADSLLHPTSRKKASESGRWWLGNRDQGGA